MSKRDLFDAEKEVLTSTREFEIALNHLKEKIELGTQQIVEFKDRATEATSVLRDPSPVIKSVIERNRQPVVDFVNRAMGDFQEDAKSVVQRSLEEAGRSMDSFIDIGKRSARQFLSDLRVGVDQELKQLDEFSLASWASILFMGGLIGFFLGMGYARQARGIGSVQEEPESIPIDRSSRSAA